MADEGRLFKDQVVIVTGGGQGLGRQYCLDFAREGARVLVASRSDTAQRVAEEITASGGVAAAVSADVRDAELVTQAAVQAFGKIDAVVVNAGITRDRSFSKMELAEWAEVLEVHLDGAFLIAKAAWPLLRESCGSLLFTTSGAGFHGAFGQANYATAKAGLLGLTKTLAIEGERAGIRVNAIAPMALTAMTDGVFDDALKSALLAEDVSPFALALSSRQSHVSGMIIEAGGGWASTMRWERSRGVRLNAQDPHEVLARWAELTDFANGLDHPNSTLDSLGAAAGRDRDLQALTGVLS